MTEIYETRCTNLESFLHEVFPSDYRYFIPILISAGEILLEFFDNPNIPNCNIGKITFTILFKLLN